LQNLFFEKNAILVSGDSIFSDVSALINARKIFNEGIRQVCNASYFNSDFYQKLPCIVPALILLIIALIVNLYALPSIYTQQSEIILLTLVNISLLRKIFRCMRTYYTNFYLYQSSIISFRLISGFVLFLIISIVSLVYLVFIHQDNHTPMTLIILAWLFFVNLSLITSKLLNKNGIKLLNQIQGFKLYLLMRFINDLGSGNDSRKIEKYLSYVIALDIEKQWIKSIHLKMKDNNLFNSFYCPDWLTGISLEKKTFIDCIFYEFLPAVSSLMLVEDFSRRRFAYMVDSNTDF
jgi:hypothetical protein